MPAVTPRFTDKKARLVLPARFANSAVLVEEVSETELRIRKAVFLPEDEIPFTEMNRSPLSEHRPGLPAFSPRRSSPPNVELKKAAREHRRRHG